MLVSIHALALLLLAASPAETSRSEATAPAPSVEPAASETDVARARELAEEAQLAFDDGDHALTSALLAEAYALDPQPHYILGQAQAERLAGHCSVAIPLYERYLATAPPADKAEAARMNLARCRTTAAPVAAPAVVAPAPAPVVPIATVTTAPRPADRSDARGQRRGVGMIAGGSASLVIGIAATIVGATLFARAEHAASERAFDRTLTGSRVAIGVGVPIAVAGAAVLGVGIERWTRRRSRAAR